MQPFSQCGVGKSL